jgi:hypothetical protein
MKYDEERGKYITGRPTGFKSIHSDFTPMLPVTVQDEHDQGITENVELINHL